MLRLSALMFLAAFILAGLNFRFRWIMLPDWISWTAAAIFLVSYGLYAEVMRENAYLSRTVEVQENQKVIDTGLYGIVRHPICNHVTFRLPLTKDGVMPRRYYRGNQRVRGMLRGFEDLFARMQNK